MEEIQTNEAEIEANRIDDIDKVFSELDNHKGKINIILYQFVILYFF